MNDDPWEEDLDLQDRILEREECDYFDSFSEGPEITSPDYGD